MNRSPERLVRQTNPLKWLLNQVRRWYEKKQARVKLKRYQEQWLTLPQESPLRYRQGDLITTYLDTAFRTLTKDQQYVLWALIQSLVIYHSAKESGIDFKENDSGMIVQRLNLAIDALKRTEPTDELIALLPYIKHTHANNIEWLKDVRDAVMDPSTAADAAIFSNPYFQFSLNVMGMQSMVYVEVERAIQFYATQNES